MEKIVRTNELSLGEQQLVSFTRLFLCKPDLLFLDEATSSLDETTEAQLYEILKKQLPTITLVSVGYRNTLRLFHDRIINVSCFSNAPGAYTITNKNNDAHR